MKVFAAVDQNYDGIRSIKLFFTKHEAKSYVRGCNRQAGFIEYEVLELEVYGENSESK